MENSTEKQSDPKEDLLSILRLINKNNQHILLNGYTEEAKEELAIFAYLNATRTSQLTLEEECTPLTIPALIMLNKKIHKELTQHLPSGDEHVLTHQKLLSNLENLKK